jgi:hypothetical protein
MLSSLEGSNQVSINSQYCPEGGLSCGGSAIPFLRVSFLGPLFTTR